MPESLVNIEIVRLNGGLIGHRAIARVDLKRYPFCSQIQENWQIDSLGSMSLRPGREYKGNSKDNARSYSVPFVFSLTDKAELEFTNNALRIVIDDVPITRVAVATTVTNGSFNTDLSGWTDEDEAGATSTWVTGGYMGLTGAGFTSAGRSQLVTVASGDLNKEHALRIVVQKGSATLLVGSTLNAGDYIAQTVLGEGSHSLAFTPSGNFYVYVFNFTKYQAQVAEINVEAAGVMHLPTPYAEAGLPLIRATVSKNTVFLADGENQQQRIERRGQRSWSFVKYKTENGPFSNEYDSKISMTTNNFDGDVTITASQPYFNQSMVGGLIKISSTGQVVQTFFTGDLQQGNSATITGAGVQQRRFFVSRTVDITGSTATLQRSNDDGLSWTDVATYTTPGNDAFDDGLDNQTLKYRLIVKSGQYGGTPFFANITYSSGSLTGIARITGYTSRTVVSAEVYKEFGGVEAYFDWRIGQWSDYFGWPTSLTLAESRLHFFGRGLWNASETDNFTGFDDTIEGDSAPISRTMGSGPTDILPWALSLQRLAVGGEAALHFIVSSSLDEVLTSNNSNRREPTTIGSANIDAVKLDDAAVYAHSSSTRLYMAVYDSGTLQYSSDDLGKFVQELLLAGIVRIAVQRQPDTRVHVVLGDGSVAVFVFDRQQELNAWYKIRAAGSGFIEDAFVLPGDIEDEVRYSVRYTVASATVRYREKYSMNIDCVGATFTYEGAPQSIFDDTVIEDFSYPDGAIVTARDAVGAKIGNYTVNDNTITLSSAVSYVQFTRAYWKLGDAFKTFHNVTPTNVITGLDHLEGLQVACCADGVVFDDANGDIKLFTVTGGQITIDDDTAVDGIVCLPYNAKYKSAKRAVSGVLGAALGQMKKFNYLVLLLFSTHARGVQFGQTFNEIEDLPSTEDGKDVPVDFVWPDYDKIGIPFDGRTDTDPRICLLARAPRPACVLGMVPGTRVSDKA
jgi:hypothetical protein